MLHTSQGSGCNPFPAAQTSLDPFRTLVRALFRRPGDYKPMGCLCIYVLVCLFVCVSVWVCVSLTSYACFYVSLCMFICLLVCFHVSVCQSVSLWVVYMSVSLCV